MITFESWSWFMVGAACTFVVMIALAMIVPPSQAHNDTSIIGCDREVMERIDAKLRRIEGLLTR